MHNYCAVAQVSKQWRRLSIGRMLIRSVAWHGLDQALTRIICKGGHKDCELYKIRVRTKAVVYILRHFSSLDLSLILTYQSIRSQ